MIVLMLLLIVTMMKTLVTAMTIDGRDGTDRVYKRQRRPPPSLKHNPEHSVVFGIWWSQWDRHSSKHRGTFCYHKDAYGVSFRQWASALVCKLSHLLRQAHSVTACIQQRLVLNYRKAAHRKLPRNLKREL